MHRIKKYIREDHNFANLLRGAMLMYAAGGISIGLTFLQQLTTANLIGATVYGQFATIVGTTMLIVLIVDFRTWEATTKLVAQLLVEEAYDEVISIVTWLILFDIVFGILGTLGVIALSNLIAQFLIKAPTTAIIVTIYALMIPFKQFAVGVPLALLRLYDRFDWLAIKSIIYSIFRFAFISGVAYLGFGLKGIVIGAVFSEILNAILMGGMAFQLLRQDSRLKGVFSLKQPKHMRQAILLMRDLWFGATLKGLQIETFIPVLAFLVTPQQVGIYRVGMDIANLINRLVEPFSIVIQPNVIKIYENGNPSEINRYIRQVTGILSIFVIPCVIIVAFFGPWLFPKILSPEFIGISSVVTILAIGLGFNAITVWLRAMIVAMGLLNVQNIIGAIMAVYTIVLIVILSKFGAIGASIVMTTFLVIYNILGLIVVFQNKRKRSFHGTSKNT